jgi:hypothetical protein
MTGVFMIFFSRPSLIRLSGLLAATGFAALLSGCVIAPIEPRPVVVYRGPPVYVEPAPVVVVPAPRYYGYRGYPGYPGYRGYRGFGHWR